MAYGRCACGRRACASPAKHPDVGLDLKRHLREPAGPELVNRWFEEKPGANVAVATGTVSGIVVVDADGPSGVAELKRRGFPRTWTATSGSGGMHVYLEHPGRPVRNQKLSGIGDLKADGGLVAVAPSLHKIGRLYEWIEGLSPWDLPLAPPPSWLTLAPQKHTAVPPKPRPEAPDLEPELSRLPRGVRDLIREGDRGRYPSRSEADFAVCVTMFRAGYGLAEVWDVMTSPHNGISEKFFEKGNQGEAYLKLTIGKALEHSKARDGRRGRPAITYDRRKGGFFLG
ncbi:MAG: bifunctional DNA primase/polymerase [Actinomycetota bacterium]|nr:bifunctional DNA primase/polymerase [Actinomycetota bacterium]